METFAFRIRLSFDRIIEIVEHLHSNTVGIFVIVSEEWRAVQDRLSHRLGSFEIISHRFQQFVHRPAFIFEYMFFQRRQAVGNRTESRTLDIGRIIARTAVVIIPSFRYAIVDEERQEGGRCILGKHTVDIVADTHLHIHKVADLLHKGGI